MNGAGWSHEGHAIIAGALSGCAGGRVPAPTNAIEDRRDTSPALAARWLPTLFFTDSSFDDTRRVPPDPRKLAAATSGRRVWGALRRPLRCRELRSLAAEHRVDIPDDPAHPLERGAGSRGEMGLHPDVRAAPERRVRRRGL